MEEEKENIEMSHLSVDCIESNTQKFALDEEGNLKVKSINIKEASSYLDLLYPIGAIYLSTTSENPSSLFGGIWEQIKERFLFGCSEEYPNGLMGGESSHILSEEEMPSHKHSYIVNIQHSDGEEKQEESLTSGLTVGGRRRYTDETMAHGNNKAHNNMPPYLSVYMWKRVE